MRRFHPVGAAERDHTLTLPPAQPLALWERRKQDPAGSVLATRDRSRSVVSAFFSRGLGFPTGHAAAGFIVHTGAVTWALRKQPCFYMSPTLEARVLFQ